MAIKNQALKKTIGIILIVLGVLALITPFTPGGWLAFIGLGLLGFRLVSKDGKLSLKRKISKKSAQ